MNIEAAVAHHCRCRPASCARTAPRAAHPGGPASQPPEPADKALCRFLKQGPAFATPCSEDKDDLRSQAEQVGSTVPLQAAPVHHLPRNIPPITAGQARQGFH